MSPMDADWEATATMRHVTHTWPSRSLASACSEVEERVGVRRQTGSDPQRHAASGFAAKGGIVACSDAGSGEGTSTAGTMLMAGSWMITTGAGSASGTRFTAVALAAATSCAAPALIAARRLACRRW